MKMQEICVEIVLKSNKFNWQSDIVPLVQYYLSNNEVKPNTALTNFNKELYPALYDAVRAIIVENFEENENGCVNFGSSEVRWFYYTLDVHGPLQQIEDTEEGTKLNVSTHLVLPSEELYNLWENLYYDNNVKQDLLNYAETMMYFSDKHVDPFIINCNRTILLHGPPGTGKTSLCKALAQKLAIRLQNRFDSGMLVEINSHSLFSKWFSESGKLVTNMFDKIREIIENPRVFVCVLIDEVESLAHARSLCVSGNEPSDSVRVVNALLTQIDQIKRYPNLLILTTSNITESIDIAFVDRADIKQFLGLPSEGAIRRIYSTCLEELLKRQIISITAECDEYSERKLRELCEKSVGLSGRTLRKIPFIAHALFVRKSSDCSAPIGGFLDAMEKAIARERNDRHHMTDLK